MLPRLLLASRPLADLKAYLRWHVLSNAAPALSPAFVNENFAFYGRTLRGVPELKPRWKRCVAYVDGQLGEALGREFVRRTFPPEVKDKALRMTRQVEAAMALGLSRWQRFRFIVFPQAMRTILPPLGNDFVTMVKDSSFVSVLGVADITQMGKIYSAGSFRFFETYSIVAYIYLLLTISLSLALRALERRLRQSRR